MIRIGITTSFEDEEQRLHHAYVRAVEHAGGLPLLVPMLEDEAATRAVAELLDGLVITGGPAVTVGLIGELPDDINETPSVRLASDRWMLEAMLDDEKPVLGICYGMQLLNARFGGTIYADVERQCTGALVHSAKRGAEEHGLHVKPGTVMHRLLDTESTKVNTRHIQAIASAGTIFQVAATAPDDTIEAIENESGTLLGVQFHPERMGAAMLPLFKHLVTLAQARKESPSSLVTAI